MAGKGLNADYYQSFLGQVNKEKRRFSAGDRILVKVTLIGHIGRAGSVFLRRLCGPLASLLRLSVLRKLFNAEGRKRAAESRREPQRKLLERDVDGPNYAVAHIDLQLVSTR